MDHIMVIPKPPAGPRCPHCQTMETNSLISEEFPCYPSCQGCKRIFRLDYKDGAYVTEKLPEVTP